ncbi:MAG TPA: hypothetical protein VEC16_04725 [Alphaproteobacteria bacterium]|nr:hypothetical protein [Alphaproteobacteria bacterium]
MPRGKRGYYFIIDALVGSTIIFISLMIILNNTARPTKIQYNYELAEDYSTFIITTKLEDISNPYINNLIINGTITDTRLTIMEQVDLFYYNNDLPHAAGMIRNITEPLIPAKYGFEYNMINGTNTVNIYRRNASDINNANVVIVSRKITFLQVNSAVLFGPATTEIKTWI